MEPSPLSQLAIPCISFIISLSIRAVFAFLETSITALRLFKLKEMATENIQYGPLFATLEKHPHRVLISILITSSLADVTTAALGTYIAEEIFKSLHFSSGIGFSFGIGLASIAIILFGEIIPKNMAKRSGEDYFPSMLWLVNLVYYTLYPIATMLMNISDAFMYRISGQYIFEQSSEALTSEKEIRFLIDYIHDKGLMDTEKTAMIQNIFELGGTPVRDIMIPGNDIISIDIATPLNEALQVFAQHQYTRLPVYQDTPDNIIGMVHQKDLFVLLSKQQDIPLRDIVRHIIFVPESMKINQLLQQFKRDLMHIAIVLNEHGILVGLITLEDILEEIVGDISDEHEAITDAIIELPQGGFLIRASTSLEDLTEHLSIPFNTETSYTLGGFITEYLQHLPKKGERFSYMGYIFQVQKASPKRVQQVLVFKEEDNH